MYSQISLSFVTPRARNNANNSIGFFTLGIVINNPYPNPLFFDEIIISICFGDIHLKSGIDFISAYQFHFVDDFPSKQ